MRSIEIARALARRRAALAGAAALAALGLVAGSLPLLDAPGYELGEAGALLAALLAPPLGLAAVRLEEARPAPSPLAAWGGASLVLSGLLAVLFVAALARAAGGACSALGPGAGFLPLLALPSALLGAALAVATAVLARGRAGRAAALYALVALLSLAVSLREAYLGPAAFVFDALLGGWPGPLYDEALVPDARALLLRLGAVAEAVAVAAFVEGVVRARRAGLRAAAGPLLALALGAGGALGAHAALRSLGLSGEREVVARVLGGRREGPRCTVVHPAEKPAAAVAALAAECEFHQADVARALGIAAPPHVTLYAYRSAEEKRRLVGAAGTEYAKPWLAEIHVVDGPAPHPVLRHELVHAVAAPVAGGALGVPARGLVLVSAGLVEGLAVALETPRGAWTVHEWSRAARDLGLLPDVVGLVGPGGFWTAAPARAYTAAGSFLAFLLESRGAEAVRAAYRTGDLAAATGAPLETLAREWQGFLDGVEVPPGLAQVAQARLSRRSLFARPCAREIASLEARAGEAAREGRTAEACALYRSAAERSGAPRALVAAASVLARAGDLDGARGALEEAGRRAGGDPALRDAIAALRGDLAWRAGDVAAASTAWRGALAASPDRAEARLLQAKLVAAADPALREAARDWLLGEGDPALALARVARVHHPLAAYLVGRALAARGEARAAADELARAAGAALPEPIGREAALLLGEARCAAGDVPGGERALEAAAAGAAAAERARAAEARRRCAFEAARPL